MLATISPSLTTRSTPCATIERTTVYAQAGHFAVGAEPTAVTSIVSSSVAVCLFDEQRGVGGVNHYLLAKAPPKCEQPGRFGDSAILELISRLESLGARKRFLRARIIGGATVSGAIKEGSASLGELNVEIARTSLAQLRIPIVSSDTGGNRGRKFTFHTDTGALSVKPI